jgi:hypothetical protein
MYLLVSKTAQRPSSEEILEDEKLQNREVGFLHSFLTAEGSAPTDEVEWRFPCDPFASVREIMAA